MHASAFDRAAASFRGALFVAEDGTVEGFCADPLRPDLRCEVEILVEDRVVARALARELREDLLASGFPDGAHGFRCRLPHGVLPQRMEAMVRARVKGARHDFARRLLVRPLVADAISERERALASRIDALSQEVAALARHPAAVPGAAWRNGLREVAGRMQRQAGRAAPVPDLPLVRHPLLTVVLPPLPDIDAAWRRLTWLAPVARALSAEVLALYDADATDFVLIGGLVPNLLLAEASDGPMRAAAARARGKRVALLDPDTPDPSRAVLEHVLGTDLAVFGPAAPAWLPPWVLPASPGVLAVLPREMLDAPDWAGVLARTRAARLECLRVEL